MEWLRTCLKNSQKKINVLAMVDVCKIMEMLSKGMEVEEIVEMEVCDKYPDYSWEFIEQMVAIFSSRGI